MCPCIIQKKRCSLGQALEKALLAFHTTKMTDINKTIKELWQKTYRNQDIDYIQAHSCMNCSPLQSIRDMCMQRRHSCHWERLSYSLNS